MAGTNFLASVTSTLKAELVDDNGLIRTGTCTGTPPTTADVFAHGALLTRTDSGTGNKAVYENVGSSAVPSWNLVGDVTAGEITLAQNNLLQGNASGVAEAVTNITLPKEGSRTISVAISTTANTVGGSLAIAGGAGVGTGAGGAASLTGGASGAGATGNGGAATITGGAAISTDGTGGDAILAGGVGVGTGTGGAIGGAGGAGGATGAGGDVQFSGGVGGATSGAGGAVSLAGGAATAGNSAGGAVTIDGGAGQGTSAGGAVTITTGASENGTAVNPGASGALTLTVGAAGTATTGTAGAGGAVAITGVAGGASTGASSTAGAGSSVTITAGAGGASSGGGDTGGAGGNLILTAGAAGTGATSGRPGLIFSRSLQTVKQGAPAAKTVSATLTAAEILTGIITVNQAGGATSALQLPTVTDLEAALPSSFAADDAFDISVINLSTVDAEDASITTNTGWTLQGSMDFHAYSAAGSLNSSGILRLRKTGAGAWTAYRFS